MLNETPKNSTITTEEYHKLYFTERGLKALTRRLQQLTMLYLRNPHYPFVGKMLSFFPLKIHSKEHHQGMIDELTQLLGKDKSTMTVIEHEVKNELRPENC